MIQIKTNIKKESNLFYPELSYTVVGILYSTHNELGPWAREKQYSDIIERNLKEAKIPYLREKQIGSSGNILDFIIDNKIILEIKSKRIIVKEDYEQTQRYLQTTQLKLAILVNFRSQYIKPIRIVKIDLVNQH